MTWMIVWGQKSKHQKIPGPKIPQPNPPPPQKKSHTELRGRNTRAPPRIFTYIKPPKIILAQFSYSKNSRNRKFQTQKILLSSPSLEIRSTSTLFLFNLKFLNRKISLWRTSQPQNRLSNTKLNRKDWKVQRKQPSIFYFLETEIHATGKRNTLNSGERACNKLQWVS